MKVKVIRFSFEGERLISPRVPQELKELTLGWLRRFCSKTYIIGDEGTLNPLSPRDAAQKPQGFWKRCAASFAACFVPKQLFFREVVIKLHHENNFSSITALAVLEKEEMAHQDFSVWNCALHDKSSGIFWDDLRVEGMHFNRFWLRRKRQNSSPSHRKGSGLKSFSGQHLSTSEDFADLG